MQKSAHKNSFFVKLRRLGMQCTSAPAADVVETKRLAAIESISRKKDRVLPSSNQSDERPTTPPGGGGGGGMTEIEKLTLLVKKVVEKEAVERLANEVWDAIRLNGMSVPPDRTETDGAIILNEESWSRWCRVPSPDSRSTVPFWDDLRTARSPFPDPCCAPRSWQPTPTARKKFYETTENYEDLCTWPRHVRSGGGGACFYEPCPPNADVVDLPRENAPVVCPRRTTTTEENIVSNVGINKRAAIVDSSSSGLESGGRPVLATINECAERQLGLYEACWRSNGSERNYFDESSARFAMLSSVPPPSLKEIRSEIAVNFSNDIASHPKKDLSPTNYTHYPAYINGNEAVDAASIDGTVRGERRSNPTTSSNSENLAYRVQGSHDDLVHTQAQKSTNNGQGCHDDLVHTQVRESTNKVQGYHDDLVPMHAQKPTNKIQGSHDDLVPVSASLVITHPLISRANCTENQHRRMICNPARLQATYAASPAIRRRASCAARYASIPTRSNAGNGPRRSESCCVVALRKPNFSDVRTTWCRQTDRSKRSDETFGYQNIEYNKHGQTTVDQNY